MLFVPHLTAVVIVLLPHLPLKCNSRHKKKTRDPCYSVDCMILFVSNLSLFPASSETTRNMPSSFSLAMKYKTKEVLAAAFTTRRWRRRSDRRRCVLVLVPVLSLHSILSFLWLWICSLLVLCLIFLFHSCHERKSLSLCDQLVLDLKLGSLSCASCTTRQEAIQTASSRDTSLHVVPGQWMCVSLFNWDGLNGRRMGFNGSDESNDGRLHPAINSITNILSLLTFLCCFSQAGSSSPSLSHSSSCSMYCPWSP